MKKALKVVVCFMMMLSSFAMSKLSVSAQDVENVIVVDAKKGNDNNQGTFEYPVQTIAKAQQLVREKNADMSKDLHVYLRGGTYVMDEPVVFTSADGGTNGYNVVWSSYEDEKVILSGGASIQGWTKVDGEENIWKASANGIDSRDFYVNGERAVLARENVTGLLDSNTKEAYVKRDNLPESFARIEDLEIVFGRKWKWAILRVDTIKTYTDSDDYGNAFRLRYTSESKEAFKANLSGADLNDVAMSEGMLYLQNAYELLDEPGEFYLNKEEDLLYYIPKEGEDMNNVEAVLGKLENLVVFNGTADAVVKNITLKGLTFQYSTFLRPNLPDGLQTFQASALIDPDDAWNREWIPTTGSAVYGEYVDNIAITGNRFELLGNTGVHLGIATKNSSITHNELEKLGGAGIILGGTESQHHKPEKADLTENNEITDNVVTNIANTYRGCTGILVGYTYGTNVSYNTIRDLPYTGISVGWGWGYGECTREDEGRTDEFVLGDFVLGKNVISYNRVENVLIEPALIDGGGIYTLGRQDGTVMTNNYIDGVHNEYGGIYLDEGSVGFDITNNVVTNCVRNWLYKGDYNYIYDNYATPAQQPNRDEKMPVEKDNPQYRFENNDLWDESVVAVIKAASGARPPKAEESLLLQLNNAVDQVDALDLSLYTNETAANVQEAYDRVLELLASDYITQEEAEKQLAALQAAVESLVYQDADYTAVDEAIAKAEALNKDDYKDFSAVKEAIAAVVRGKNITEQEEVDAMAQAILDAIAKLEKVEAEPIVPIPEPETPKTGDTSQSMIYFVTAILALVGWTILSLRKYQKQ